MHSNFYHRSYRSTLHLGISLLMGLVLAACGGGSDVSSNGTAVDRQATAAAASPNYFFEIWVTGPGKVVSNPAGISCTGTSSCVGYFKIGSTVTLTATPDSGATVTDWTHSCSGTASTCTFVMSEVRSAGITFTDTTAVAPPPPVSGTVAPLVLYTDITSGPNTGGENNDGIYLSIFGKNFGTSLGASGTTRVYIGGHEVSSYRYIGASRGRPDVQQITVQIGNIGNPANFVPEHISVVTNGVASVDGPYGANNFTVVPGNIYFVATTGVDTTTTTTGGTITTPFKHLQLPGIGLSFSIDPASVSGAYGRVRAGDFIVMRAGTYSGATGFGGYFMQMLNKSGCPLQTNCSQGGGTTSGPITVMGYPTETVNIEVKNTGNYGAANGGISSADNARQQLGMGAYWNFSNLVIEAGFADGPMNAQRGDLNPQGGHWRVVNNELTMTTCSEPLSGGECLAGGISGGGAGHFWVGNYAHDIYDGPNNGSSGLQDHGIYVGYNGPIEIGYNYFKNIYGGNGIQLHNTSSGAINGITIDHNLINTVNKHGINLADNSGSGITVYDNVVMYPAQAGLRMGGTSIISGLKVYNNTFFHTGTGGNNPSSGAITNDMSAASTSLNVSNNIFVPASGAAYYAGDGNTTYTGCTCTFSHNLWYGGSGTNPASSFSAASLLSNPLFMSTTAGSENLATESTSPAVNAGMTLTLPSGEKYDDFNSATSKATQTLRPMGAEFDIGAYEQ